MSAEEPLVKMFNSLLNVCIEDPDSGLQILSGMTKETPTAKYEYLPHILYFIAYGSKALREDQAGGGDLSDETISLLEKSAREYRIALNIATYEEEESYEEEVVVKAGGFFRKPQTKIVTKTRKVTKTRFNFQEFDQILDSVAQALEKVRPGSVQKILGFTKIKYLANSILFERDSDIGTLNKKDWLSLGEVILKTNFIIKTIYFFNPNFDNSSRALHGFAYDLLIDNVGFRQSVDNLLSSGRPLHLFLVIQDRSTGIWQLASKP